jgi:hypothetical protein
MRQKVVGVFVRFRAPLHPHFLEAECWFNGGVVERRENYGR